MAVASVGVAEADEGRVQLGRPVKRPPAAAFREWFIAWCRLHLWATSAHAEHREIAAAAELRDVEGGDLFDMAHARVPQAHRRQFYGDYNRDLWSYAQTRLRTTLRTYEDGAQSDSSSTSCPDTTDVGRRVD